ncbi:MAG: PTS sugar transporter subunit IIA [Candidatus Aminicenantales bacterium]
METSPQIRTSFFSDYLKLSHVIYDLQAQTKVEALDELLDILQKDKLIENKKLILTRIIDRERLETTAIGNGIALPHARVDAGGDIAVAAGRSEKGIDFEALDKKKVHLVILVIWNPSLPGLFNHLFAGLAGFLRKTDFRQRAFEAKDKEALYHILSQIELRIPQEDKIVSRASLLKKLQDIGFKLRKTPKSQRGPLEQQARLIRGELDQNLLSRYDRLMQRYGFAVAELEAGVCQGCNINVATGMSSAIAGSNDIYICENCGKFLVAAKKVKEKEKEKAKKSISPRPAPPRSSGR